ncbi:zinc finger CCCH domain-containing protein 5 [Citrus sinensis]|nr:zinc finger CCCH domain-containing protein 5 [Citrus sinensis]
MGGDLEGCDSEIVQLEPVNVKWLDGLGKEDGLFSPKSAADVLQIRVKSVTLQIVGDLALCYFAFASAFTDFCGFTEVNPYPIHRLRIFKFSIHIQSTNPRIGFIRIELSGSDGLGGSDWILNTPNMAGVVIVAYGNNGSILAVELDTFKNKNKNDPDNNHIGIDIASLISDPAKSLDSFGIDLKSGRPIQKLIERPIVMSETVLSSVYVGFTASTGLGRAESHQRWREEGKTGHNGASQHDKCSHVSNRCHPSPRTGCHLASWGQHPSLRLLDLDTYPPIRRWGRRELATYPPLAHQLRHVLGASRIWRQKENECDEDDDWEYVEEGPAEIIWQGNEIIIKKKKVRVPKKDANPLSKKEDVDRPTSNPLPPQSEAFVDHQNAQQALETVAQQDKAYCPFHLKIGACRFGQRCNIVHFYPDKSCTLLIKNMYNGLGLAWEQDERLEVCRNGSSHLRGNVYVHYKSLESAVLAYHSVNGRYFTGKQITCEFINVTRWKIAICGEYMKSRLKTCSCGMACNFIHYFRNPSGDYEWANWDKPPPRYWVKKMAALFGYSDESGTWNQERSGQTRNKIDSTNADRHHYRRSRSREADIVKSGSGRSHDDERQVHETTWSRRRSNYHSESRSDEANSDGSWSDRDRD